MTSRSEERFKTVLQVFAILGLAAIMLVLLHKGYSDVNELARTHGQDFWQALARYALRNLAGG